MYLVNAVFNNKAEKITEFFKLMTPELQNQNEWKEWFSKLTTTSHVKKFYCITKLYFSVTFC